jgi:23S rRNA G2445 N2-methylase RlmL
MALHKALALTFPGMADICAAEIRELTGIAAKELGEGVLFETKNLADIFTACYRLQSAIRVLLVVSDGALEELKIPAEYLKGTTCISGKSSTQANELAEKLGTRQTYKNPDVPLYLHQECEHCFLGIDLTGDASKRDYRIFIGSETLSGVTAFGALALSGYAPKHALLDPNCRAGSIVIEAAFAALQMPVRYYSKPKLPFVKLFNKEGVEGFFSSQDKAAKDKIPGAITALSSQFPSVQATRKNAKVAGVVKALDFSRTDTDWLDIKFEKQSIDRVVTQPVELSKNFPPDKFKKQATLFLERCSFVLKKSGKLALILRQGMEEYKAMAKEKGLEFSQERAIMQGKERWNVLIFLKV